jgi:hypothetical protein
MADSCRQQYAFKAGDDFTVEAAMVCLRSAFQARIDVVRYVLEGYGHGHFCDPAENQYGTSMVLAGQLRQGMNRYLLTGARLLSRT